MTPYYERLKMQRFTRKTVPFDPLRAYNNASQSGADNTRLARLTTTPSFLGAEHHG